MRDLAGLVQDALVRPGLVELRLLFENVTDVNESVRMLFIEERDLGLSRVLQ